MIAVADWNDVVITCTGCGENRRRMARSMCSTCYGSWRRSQVHQCAECGRLRPRAAGDLCGACYKRRRPPVVSAIPCSLGGCTGPRTAKGMCSRHYQALMRHGDPYGTAAPLTKDERFERLIDKNGPLPSTFRDRGPCWVWRLRPGKNGYGSFRPSRTERWLAHRYSWELHVGPIPDGLVIDHLCRNRVCVNPRHLEPVTNGENVRRGLGVSTFNALKKACPYGHPYSTENTYRTSSQPGSRKCIACRRARDRTPERLARKHVRKAA